MDRLAPVRREAVVRLCRAQADGRLSPERFEERYALLRDATSAAAIEAIVADLSEDSGAYGAGSPATPAHGELAPRALPPLRIPAIFGSATRAGNWNVPEEISLLVVFGETHLDFRDATFTTDTVIVDVSLTLGSLKLTVPAGTQVENDCREVLSSSKHSRPRRQRRAAEPNGLLIVVQGRLLFGELVIKEQPSDEEPTLLERLGLRDSA